MICSLESPRDACSLHSPSLFWVLTSCCCQFHDAFPVLLGKWRMSWGCKPQGQKLWRNIKSKHTFLFWIINMIWIAIIYLNNYLHNFIVGCLLSLIFLCGFFLSCLATLPQSTCYSYRKEKLILRQVVLLGGFRVAQRKNWTTKL